MGINKNYKRGIFLLILLLTIISGIFTVQNVNYKYIFDESTLSTSAPEDLYEPNNNATSAYDLTMYRLTWLSLINGPGAQWDDDWYKIEITSGTERLIVKLIFKHIEGDIDLELYNSTLDLITGSYSTDDCEFFDIILPTGQYYLKVYYGNIGNNYDLIWEGIDPVLSDDSYEENDVSSTPYVLSGNQSLWLSQINGFGIQADDDWYEIYVNPGFERLIVDCVFSNQIGNIDLDIYNATYSMIASSWTNQNYERIDFVVPSAGVYYIRLHSGNGGNTYDLRWDSVIPSPPDDVYEDNDYYWEAYDLSAWSASWLPYGIGIQADDDWYRVYLDPGEEQLHAELSFSHASGNIDMEVWYWNGPFTYLSGSYSLDDNERIDIVVPWSGEYYIRVFGNNMSNTYDLFWEDLSPSGSDDWMEENDDFYGARLVDPNYYSGLKIVGTDEDWFRIYLEQGDKIETWIYFYNFDGDLDFELIDPNDYSRTGSYSTDDNEFITFTADITGEWRLRVYQYNGMDYVPYDLDIWIFKGGDDAYEFNNHPSEATLLLDKECTWLSDIKGEAVSGDEDWYIIEITPGFNYLNVEVKFNHSDGNIDISVFEVYEWNREWNYINFGYIGGNFSIDDNEQFKNMLYPGFFLIQIHGQFSGNKYDLWWDDVRTDFRSEDNYEENDTPLNAYDLSSHISHWDQYGVSGTPLQHIMDIGIQSDNDWYRLTVGPDFLELRIVILYEYAEGPIGLELYDWDLSKLSGNFTMSDNEYLSYVLPSNGTYYIRIYGDNSGGPYDLWWELREYSERMIPGYNVLIIISGIFGVSTIITIQKRRSKKNN
ncbi:MAG: T9SS type A sorting domain-containing protein [Promethearchaeota archaeon]